MASTSSAASTNIIKDSITYESFRKGVKNFDIIFFKGDDIVNKIISEAEKMQTHIGDFTHIGMALRGDSMPLDNILYNPNRLYILESTMGGKLNGGVTAATDGKTHFGVQIRDFDEIWALEKKNPDTIIAWAPIEQEKVFDVEIFNKITSPKTDADRALIYSLAEKYLGLNYDAQLLDLGATAGCGCLRVLRSLFKSDKKSKGCCGGGCCNWFLRSVVETDIAPPKLTESPRDRMICSELVARVFQDAKYIKPGTVFSENVLPVDFIPKTRNETWDADKAIPVLIYSIHTINKD